MDFELSVFTVQKGKIFEAPKSLKLQELRNYFIFPLYY